MSGHCRAALRRIWSNAKAALTYMAIGGLTISFGETNAIAEPLSVQPSRALVQCEPIVSLEKRLHMMRWAPNGECDRPTRAAITDFFLGYSCVMEAGIDSCRSFVPRPGSRAFDTSKGFRCLELSLTMNFEGEYHVHRLREWATVPTTCEWDPNLGLLATEVDFEESQVCAASACISFQRLSSIGKARLRYLVLSAFRENGVTSAPDIGPRSASSVAFKALSRKKASR